VLGQTLFLNNYVLIADPGHVPTGASPFWSIAVEEHFYIAFPALFVALRRRLPLRRIAAVLAGACLAVLAWRCLLVLGLHAPATRTYYATDTRLDSILWGCVLAVAYNPMLDDVPRPWSWRHRAALAGAIGLLLASLAIRAPGFRETARYTIQSLALAPIFVLAIGFHHRAVFRWLERRWVARLGVLSYSVYLVHLLVLAVLEHHVALPRVVLDGLAFGASVLLAVALHGTVESPFRRRRDAVLERIRRSQASAARLAVGVPR
jgi:peptidoglycan/LPS O-acetylase OafA/YrhL